MWRVLKLEQTLFTKEAWESELVGWSRVVKQRKGKRGSLYVFFKHFREPADMCFYEAVTSIKYVEDGNGAYPTAVKSSAVGTIVFVPTYLLEFNFGT